MRAPLARRAKRRGTGGAQTTAQMEGAMKVTQLGDANQLSWLADLEQVCKLKDCWEVVVEPIPVEATTLLATQSYTPTKSSLMATLADTEATPAVKREAAAMFGALEWKRKDQVAQAILKLNVESGKHYALKECASAREVYTLVQSSFTTRGLSGKIEMRRRLCSLRKSPNETMTGFIDRASMLKIEMKRMGIDTPEEELVAAVLAGLPTEYAGTVELLEHHGPEDMAGVTQRLLAAELKRRRLENNEEEAVALVAAASGGEPPRGPCGGPGQRHRAEQHLQQPAMYEQRPVGGAALHHPTGPPQIQAGHQQQYEYGPPPLAPPEGYAGGHPARPPRLCWGCGLPSHVQRQRATHPLAGVHPANAPIVVVL